MPANTAIADRAKVAGSTLPVDKAVGLAMGLVMPLVAAGLYHGYQLAAPSAALEITRQLGLPYVIAELGIVLYAGRRGYDVLATLGCLSGWTRRALILFLSTFWISSVLAGHAFSVALCVILLLHLHTMAAVVHLAGKEWWEPRRLALGLALGLLALTPLLIVHLGFPPADAGPSTWVAGAPIPGFISNRLFGAWCGVVFALLAGIAWRGAADGTVPIWLNPAVALAAGLVVWSGTRAAVLGDVAALVIGAWLTRGRAARGFWSATIPAIGIGALLGPLLIPAGDPLLVLFRFNAPASVNAVSTGRVDLWIKTLHVAAHHPLLGNGMGSNRWLVSLSGIYHVQPHNALVQFLMNWGIIPTVPALFLLGVALTTIHAIGRRHPERVPLVMAIDFLLVVSLFDGMLYFTEFLALLAIFMGACLSRMAGGEPHGIHQRRPSIAARIAAP